MEWILGFFLFLFFKLQETYINFSLYSWRFKFNRSKFLAIGRWWLLCERWLRLIFRWWILRSARNTTSSWLRCAAWWPNSCYIISHVFFFCPSRPIIPKTHTIPGKYVIYERRIKCKNNMRLMILAPLFCS